MGSAGVRVVAIRRSVERDGQEEVAAPDALRDSPDFFRCKFGNARGGTEVAAAYDGERTAIAGEICLG